MLYEPGMQAADPYMVIFKAAYDLCYVTNAF